MSSFSKTSETLTNDLTDVVATHDFTSGVWTFVNSYEEILSPPFAILNAKVNVQFLKGGICSKFGFKRGSSFINGIYLRLIEPKNAETVVANGAFSFLESDNKNVLKIEKSFDFRGEGRSKYLDHKGFALVLNETNYVLHRDKIYKIYFIIAPLGIQSSSTNSKYLEEQRVSTNNVDKNNINPDSISIITLVNDLENMLLSQKCGDFFVKVDGIDIAVYKGILASRSPVFYAMLEHDFAENQRGYVEITDIHKDTVLSLIRFLYTSKVFFQNVYDAQMLFAAADKYNVSDLKRVCQNYILANMDPSNIADILIFIDCYNEVDFKAHVMRYAAINFKTIYPSQIAILGQKAPVLLGTLFQAIQNQ